jgi:hypothetical protein
VPRGVRSWSVTLRAGGTMRKRPDGLTWAVVARPFSAIAITPHPGGTLPVIARGAASACAGARASAAVAARPAGIVLER